MFLMFSYFFQANLQILMSQLGEVERIILNTPRSNDPDWSVFEYAKYWVSGVI